MLKNDAFILTLAYPETIVRHPEEWYPKFLRFLSVGNEKYIRAGHTGLVLIHKETGVLEYFDFGRYITTSPNGRVRAKETDFELDFSLKAKIEEDKIVNLDKILAFFATQPKLTHGCGTLYASICNAVDYQRAQNYIKQEQNKGFIRYAAFKKEATNCARFVTDTLIASVSHRGIKKKLISSKRFTPSTIGNVVIADTENHVYLVSEKEHIEKFNSTVRKVNRYLFFDNLKGYSSDLIGAVEPNYNTNISDTAQWLGGIGIGAWFEIYDLNSIEKFRLRRISPHGNVDCDGVYKINQTGFDINSEYTFTHDSNCACFYLQQNETLFEFCYIEDYE